MNAHTGEIVRRSLQPNHMRKLKLTNSQVMLHWISNNQKPDKQWVWCRVVKILRFIEPSEWMFVSSQYVIADLETWRVNDLNLVDKDSTWINGYDWMKKDQKDFPTKSIHQIRPQNEDLSALQKENILKYHNQDCNSEIHIRQMNTYLVIVISIVRKYFIKPAMFQL